VVTRAEMAKLVVTALGVDKYATATTSQFYDMSAAEWAIPYVEYAANLNIVNGYGNGKFGPNDTVTYEQAVTMIVRALGYTDECKEMNGTWPAIYVQKATALGLFTDVVNGGSTGADRGDVAIMLYNALTLPEVYADGDGTTQYKSGSEEFSNIILTNGNTLLGVSMLGILNKNGSSSYDVIDNNIVDKAVYDITKYYGALAKVYTNKESDVIAIGDIKTTFIKGTFNKDLDEFTSNGTTYKVASDAFNAVDTYVYNSSNGLIGNKSGSGKADKPAVKLINGVESNLTAKLTSNSGDLLYNKTYTLAAKVSGVTINYVVSVVDWNADADELVDDSDVSNISANHKLLGYEFYEDDNGDIDTSSFVLEGVDSVDDIAKDNVVYVYLDGSDKIRKVEVGTEVVTGTLDSFTQSSSLQDTANSNNGKEGTIVIAGTSYKTTATPDASIGDKDDVTKWTKATDDDNVAIGDTVKAYLNAAGKVYKLELEESGSSSYALVLDYDYSVSGSDDKEVIVNDKSLNGDTSKIKVLTADGNVYTLSFKNEATVKEETTSTSGSTTTTKTAQVDASSLTVGDIITYSLNSSNEVKSVTIKAQSTI
jgi:hypothetical protein